MNVRIKYCVPCGYRRHAERLAELFKNDSARASPSKKGTSASSKSGAIISSFSTNARLADSSASSVSAPYQVTKSL